MTSSTANTQTFTTPGITMDPSLEQAILSKYNLTTLWPTRWPDEKNDESDSDGEAPTTVAAARPVRRSRSRYSVLEDRSRFSRQVLGAERTKDGKENLVQKDEQDPLGMYPSVVQVLRTRNVQVEEDIKLRMRNHDLSRKFMSNICHRQSLPPELHHLLAPTLPFTSAQRCIHRHAACWPRIPLQFD